MFFKDKLNTMMMLAGVSNVRLAKALHIDPSLVSRWRRGSRVPAANSEYWHPLAEYFTNSISSEYQITALLQLLNINDTGITGHKLTAELEGWFRQGYGDETQAIEHLFDIFTLDHDLPQTDPLPAGKLRQSSDNPVYIGRNGMRHAVIRLLELMIRENYEGDVFYFSDEPIDWLIEDEHYYKLFVSMISELAGRVSLRIVFPVSSVLSDSFTNLDVLLPIYRIANIQSYFCPKYRRGLFQQFLCVAPGLACIMGQSLYRSDNNICGFSTDREAVSALTSEFRDLFSLCYSPFHIFNAENSVENMEEAIVLHKAAGSMLAKGSLLPQITMPPELMDEIIDKTHLSPDKKEQLKKSSRRRHTQFLEHIRSNRNVMIVSSPNFEDLRERKLEVFHSRAYFNEEVCYTPQEYLRHLTYMIRLLEENPLYSVCVTDNSWPDIFVHANYGISAVIHKINTPYVTLSTTDSKLVDIIYSYLENEFSKLTVRERSRERTIAIFREWIAEIGRIE